MYKDMSIELLNLKDSDLEILNMVTRGSVKEIFLQKKLRPQYCPLCKYKMYSKGIYQRKVNHPILQDGFQIKLIVGQRRWKCTNSDCGYTSRDEFSFLSRYKHNTNMTELLIVEAFRDLNSSATQIARKFNVSDTFAIQTFLRYVDMPRRNLTETICIDEVKVDIYKKCKYALVIQDFKTGEPIDILPSRRDDFTQEYFSSISPKERQQVKYVVSDMYAPYALYLDKYFHNAIHVVDSFHVIKLINQKILTYINALTRKQKTKDEERHAKLEYEFKRRIDYVPSQEYYLLKHCHWVVLSNIENLNYHQPPHYNKRLKRYMDTSEFENLLFQVAPELRIMRDLKEEYIRFNQRYLGDPKRAKDDLLSLIRMYRESEYIIFNEVAETLDKYFDAIINSFILAERYKNGEVVYSRMSNGPMESLNRTPKDMKRAARGYKNWEYFRNRFLFSKREHAAILGTPKSLAEVCFKTGKKRGPYDLKKRKLKDKIYR